MHHSTLPEELFIANLHCGIRLQRSQLGSSRGRSQLGSSRDAPTYPEFDFPYAAGPDSATFDLYRLPAAVLTYIPNWVAAVKRFDR